MLELMGTWKLSEGGVIMRLEGRKMKKGSAGYRPKIAREWEGIFVKLLEEVRM